MLDFFYKICYNIFVKRKGDKKIMTNEMLEELVEEVMRCYHMGNYEEYSSEELREKYRQMLKEEKRIERIEK